MRALTLTRWKPEEDEVIRSLWSTRSAKQIARVINRTDSAIKQRAIAIGLRKYKRVEMTNNQASKALPPLLPV